MINRKLAGAFALTLMAGAVVVGTAAPAAATGSKTCPPVLHSNTGDITLAGQPDPTVTLLAKGVQVSTSDNNDQGATWWKSVAPVPPILVHRMSYWTNKVAHGVESPEAMPAYLLRLSLPGGKTATLVYEPYGNPNDNNSPIPPGLGEKTFDVDKGTFWTLDTAVKGMIEYTSNAHAGKSLKEIAKANPFAKVVAFGWRQEWSKGLIAQVDDVEFAAGKTCEKHVWRKPAGKPAAEFVDTCTGTDVTVKSPDDRKWKFWLLRSAKTVGGPATVDKGGSKTFTVPAGPGEIVVLAKPYQHGARWATVGKHRWAEPAGCDADITSESTCDALKVKIVVPAKSGPVKVVITPGLDGAATHEFEAASGSVHNFTYPANPKVTVKVEVAGTPTEEFTWARPDDCAQPTPTPGPTGSPEPGTGGGGDDDGGGELPLTGVQVAGIAGGGGSALALGIVLYFLARRRRTPSFTAGVDQ
ncbi:hypothetical protein I0C86_41705 [Plantactinospora sp. S1510]|uniref:LPXTG-motif cell wall anchor domain-containing protein n=1 Tax=Plantactinospora alkalitolerans TaxID=2789879 RepID=A0ABS0HA78_9ACTN|nr:hypothetical protein [Plantactinospora alkalitolerans]MBF9135370.1 hypothetical protein [Plantactinospora alkalitolerans]